MEAVDFFFESSILKQLKLQFFKRLPLCQVPHNSLQACVLSAVTSAQFLQHLPPHPLLFFLREGFLSCAQGPFVQKRKRKRGEGINKNVFAVTRDLSAGNEGPGDEDKGGKTHAVV